MTTALYAGSVYHVLDYINIVLNIIPTLYEGYIVSSAQNGYGKSSC